MVSNAKKHPKLPSEHTDTSSCFHVGEKKTLNNASSLGWKWGTEQLENAVD